MSLDWVERRSQPLSRPTSLPPAAGKPSYTLGPEKRHWYATKTVVCIIIKVLFFWHRYCRPLKHATRTRRTDPLGPLKLVFLSVLKVKAEHQSAPTGIFIIQYVWLYSGGGKKCLFGQTTEQTDSFLCLVLKKKKKTHRGKLFKSSHPSSMFFFH